MIKFKLLSLGCACTIFYGVFGYGALIKGLEPKWFMIPAGVLSLVAIPLTWWQIKCWISEQETISEKCDKNSP